MDSVRISWSALRNYKDCKQRAKLIRTGKRAKLEDQRNFLPGNITDRVVRDWLKDEAREAGQMPDMVSDYLKKQIEDAKGQIKWKGTKEADQKQIEKDCIEAVTKIEPALLKFVTPFQHWADYKFEAPMHAARNGDLTGEAPIHVTLNGFMDILVHDEKNDRWFVFDVKHTRDGQYYKKTAGQLAFYGLAVELIHGSPLAGAALFQPLVEKTPVKPLSVARSTVTDLALDITRMANDIVADEMPPRDDMTMCNWCSVQHACEKFKTTTDEKGRRRIPLSRPAVNLLD